MYGPLRPSGIGALKDILVVLVFVGFLATLMGGILPAMVEAQLETLQAKYVADQERSVARAVKDAAAQTREMNALLVDQGVPLVARKNILLASLKNERFGPDANGYFFVISGSGTTIQHPLSPDLVGTSLAKLKSPSGESMDQILLGPLSQADEARVQYYWQLPGHSQRELKTGYLVRVRELDWIIGSGFYPSDFSSIRDAFLGISKKALASAEQGVFAAGLALIAVIISISTVLFLRVRKIERDLVRRTGHLEQYRSLLDKTSIVSRTTLDGKITAVNDTFCEVTGYRRADVVGVSHSIERHPDTSLEVYRDLWATILRGQVWQGTFKNRKANGTSYLKRATIMPIRDERGVVVEYLSSGQDVTEVYENRGKLQMAFMTDALTGLGSRDRLFLELDALESPGILLANIVGFTGINTVFGTTAGDEVLRALGSTLFDLGRSSSASSFRLHSDTFALIRTSPNPVEFRAWAEDISRVLKDFSVTLKGAPVPLSVRLAGARGARDVLVYADEAMGRARQTRSQFEILEDNRGALGASVEHRLSVLQTLRWALQNNQVYALYQPIQDLRTGLISRFEALMRVNGPDGQRLLPNEFIEISKQTRVYQALSTRMLQRVIADLNTRDVAVSVNLTIEDLHSTEMVDLFVKEIREYRLGSRITVEIVETEELERLDLVNRSLDRIRAEGVKLAVDDFGSGYANFDYLLKLNPSMVKIDGSLVQKLIDDPRARGLVSSIVEFAKRSGMETLAEYVDSEDIRRLVRDLGIEYAQGWLIGQAGPLP